jgi:hypothetical protein
MFIILQKGKDVNLLLSIYLLIRLERRKEVVLSFYSWLRIARWDYFWLAERFPLYRRVALSLAPLRANRAAGALFWVDEGKGLMQRSFTCYTYT